MKISNFVFVLFSFASAAQAQDEIQKSPYFNQALEQVLQTVTQKPLPHLEWETLSTKEKAKVAELVRTHEKAARDLGSKIELIQSLFARVPQQAEPTSEALHMRDDTIQELVNAYVLSKGDLDDESSDHFQQLLLGWSKTLPDFREIVTTELEIGRDEISRRSYVRKLARALALSLERFEQADGEKKEILRHISLRILSEALLVAALVEPSHAGVADVGVRFWSKLFIGPLGVVALLTAFNQSDLAQLTAIPAFAAMFVFMQNVLARDTGSKPWLIPGEIKKRAHLIRANRILREFLTELILQDSNKYDSQDPFMRTNFVKVREDIVNTLLNSTYRPLEISIDDCARVLRN